MVGPSFQPRRPTEPTILFKPAPVASARLPKGVREKLEAILEHADALYRQVPLFEEGTRRTRREAMRKGGWKGCSRIRMTAVSTCARTMCAWSSRKSWSRNGPLLRNG
jgi:hypothetical protein